MRTQLEGWIRGMQSGLERYRYIRIRIPKERVYSFVGPDSFSYRTISYHAP